MEYSHRRKRLSRLSLLLAHGFTLIELMPVIAVVGILAAISIPNFTYENSKVSQIVITGTDMEVISYDDGAQRKVISVSGARPSLGGPAVGDLNGDDRMDVVFVDRDSDTLLAYVSGPDGEYAEHEFPVGASPQDVYLGDIDGDGHLDAVAANFASHDISVLLGKEDERGLGDFFNNAVVSDLGDATYPYGFLDDGEREAREERFANELVDRNCNTPDDFFVLVVEATKDSDDISLDLVHNGGGAFVETDTFMVDHCPTGNSVAADSQPIPPTKQEPTTGRVSARETIPSAPNRKTKAFADLNGDGEIDLVTTDADTDAISVRLGDGTGGFGAPTSFGTGTDPVAIALADLDEDGCLDAVTGNASGDHDISVLLGDCAGGFDPPTHSSTAAIAASLDVVVDTAMALVDFALSDLNGDGHLDIATAHAGSSDSEVRLMFGNGSGQFGKLSYGAGDRPVAVALGDVNGDGLLDVVAANRDSQDISVLPGNGQGSLGPASHTAVTGLLNNRLRAAALADMDGDGDLDALVKSEQGYVYWLDNDGAGGLAPFDNSSLYSYGYDRSALAVGDVSADGYPDVLTAAGDSVVVIFGWGENGFSTAWAYEVGTGSTPVAVALGDLDGDSDLDIVAADRDADRVSVLFNLRDGQNPPAGDLFSAPAHFAVGDTPMDVRLADVNRDGKLDAVTANNSSHNISVLLGDGAGGFGTASHYATEPFPKKVLLEDGNGDGILDAIVLPVSSVMLGNPSGGFDPPVLLPPGVVYDMALGDLSEDLRLDAVTTDDPEDTISVWLGGALRPWASRDIDLGASPRDLALGDVNGDLRLDAVTTYSSAGDDQRIGVLRGDGGGGFDSITNFLVGDHSWSVELGVLTHTGFLDAVTANYENGSISVLKGDGAGGFGLEASYPVGRNPTRVRLGDFDGDGYLDGLTANYGDDTMSLLRGLGEGNFADAESFDTGSEPRDVAIADVDGDGYPDAVTVNAGSDDVRVFWNFGFGLVPSIFDDFPVGSAGLQPESLALGDVNNDGYADVVTANLNGANVSVLLGSDSGFGDADSVDTGLSPRPLALDDIDRDGRLDLVVVNTGDQNVSLLLGDGTGGFNLANSYYLGSRIDAVALGDLNGNGLPDVVLSDRDNARIKVLLNQFHSTDACPNDPDNDIDGDGLCGDLDPCPNDPENDADADGLCGDVDACPNDPDNDADADGLCGDVDTCPNDPDNDADADGLCGDVDPCPNDPDNDIDGDGICGDLDPCPNDPENDADGDGLCGDADACPNEDATGLDADENGCLDTLSGLGQLVDSLASDGEIDVAMVTSIESKIASAVRLSDRGNTCASVNVLEALLSQIAAQTGKKISLDAAVLLTSYTENILAQLRASLAEGETCKM